MQDTIHQKSISLTIDCDDRLEAFGDLDMFQTVIRNQVSNAVKFTNPNGHIKINAQPVDNYVSIQVNDNGIGIEKGQLDFLIDKEELKSTDGTKGRPVLV